MRIALCLTLLAALAAPAASQTPEPRAEDVATPEAIVEAGYAAIARRPGEPYDWDRFRSLFLPDARLVPNTEQTGGEFRVLTPQQFTDWIDSVSNTDAPEDPGFVEEQVHVVVERYGDVAHAFSTYQKHFWGSDEILGRGINSFQLVRHADRWWIAGVVWDEDSGAGPIPERYLPEGAGASGSSGDGSTGGTGSAGSAGGEAPGADALGAMDAVYERFTRAYALAEPDSVVALYTDEALYLPAQGDVRAGQEELRSEFGFLDRIREQGGTARIGFESLDRGASGDLAYDVGYYRLQGERADGTMMPVARGKFATVWKRADDGRWRIHVDSFSPAPSESDEGR